MTKADFVASNAYTGTEESIGSSETRDNTNNTEHAQQDSAASEDISSFNNSDRMPDADEESLMGSGLSGQQENPPNTKEKTTKMQQFLVIATAFATVFQTSGLDGAFGIFQAHYTSGESQIMRPDEARNRAAIGAIGSLASDGLLTVFAFMFTPYLENRAGIRRILVVGNAMFSLGLGLAAASTRYWQVVLTQGLIGGIGSGLVQMPLIMLVPEYFSNRPGKAMGAVTCAGSLGGLTYTPLIQLMLENIGTRKTLGVLCATNAAVLAIATTFAQGPRKFAKRSTCRVPWPRFKEPIFLLAVLMTLFNALSISTPLQYGPDFSQSLGFSTTTAATLLAIHIGIGSFSRMLIGHFGDKIGYMNTLILGMAVTSLATWTFWLEAALNQIAWPWCVFIACHGSAGTVYSTLFTSLSVQLFGNENYIAVSGILGCARGIGYVAGSPLAGLILGEAQDHDKSSKDFKAMIIWTACLLSGCTVCLVVIQRIEARKRYRKWKVSYAREAQPLERAVESK